MKKRFISACLAIFLVFLCSPAIFALNFYEEELRADSVYMLDYSNDISIVEKNIGKRRSPASLTKIVTFIVAYENSSNRNETKFKVTKEILDMVDAESSGSKLKEGEEFSITDLLHCMLISSSGYAAMTLAYHVGGGDVQKFVNMMNEKIASLGCTDTHFENPDGIYNENQYSTAADMYKITKYAMNNSDFLNIVSKSEYNMFGDERDPVITTNHMIDRKRGGKYYLPFVRGIKTGYVEDAGRCLISYAVKDGKTYVLVVMGGPTKDSDGKSLQDNTAMLDSVDLYNWAYNDLRSVNIFEKNYPLTETGLSFVWGKDRIMLFSSKDFNLMLPKNASRDDVSFEFETPQNIEAPVKKSEPLGKVHVLFKGAEVAAVDLISTKDFNKNYAIVIFEFIKAVITSKIFIFLFILLMAFAIFYVLCIIRYNIRRKNKNKVVDISKAKKK